MYWKKKKKEIYKEKRNKKTMKNILKLLPVILIAILTFLIFKQADKIKDLKFSLENRKAVPDTVYKNKYLTPPKPYKETLQPEKVFVFLNHHDSIYSVEVVEKEVKIYLSPDSLKVVEYNQDFLTNYPQASKLIYFDLTKDHISLGLLETSGLLVEDNYNLNFDRYKYRYLDNEVTYKPKTLFSKLKPGVAYTFRLLNNLHDLNAGIKYKTGNINYEIGIQGYYYPILEKPFGYDPYLKLTVGF